MVESLVNKIIGICVTIKIKWALAYFCKATTVVDLKFIFNRPKIMLNDMAGLFRWINSDNVFYTLPTYPDYFPKFDLFISILYINQYHSYWWPGSLRHQAGQQWLWCMEAIWIEEIETHVLCHNSLFYFTIIWSELLWLPYKHAMVHQNRTGSIGPIPVRF